MTLSSTSMHVPAERRRYEKVVDRLLELIAARGLGPGDALPTERELAEQFHVSRTVLRQAFGILEERGLLVTRRGSGRYLREAAQAEAGTPGRSQVEIASIADVLEARILLEAQIAQLACERRTSAEAQELVRVSTELNCWEDNVAFHRGLASATHNFALERMVVEQMKLARELHQRDHYQDHDQLKRMRQEHHAIATAVSARDVEHAAALVRAHLRGTRKLLYTQSAEGGVE